ncbi:tyrosine-type recombinase/integrase [Streptomyces sp. NPDC088256]|uniref:tyrosine-type recombinase/integrase n=2 Tax=unclassified Streptomyces TaxID=2593676 RepID=UPI0037F209A4
MSGPGGRMRDDRTRPNRTRSARARHTHATALLRAAVRLEVASELLTHGSVQTTMDTYDHLNTDNLAEEPDRVGFRGPW